MNKERAGQEPYKTVLVADDDRVVRTLLQYNLKKAGFNVITVTNGREALEQINDKIGVVLLDLYMPEMDGMTCLRRLKESFEDLSPIMITASDEISDAVEAMKYGAFDYLIKPVIPSDLVSLVKKAMHSWEQARRLRQVEAELAQAREREIYIASKIQRTLLMGKTPRNIPGMQIAQLTIPSQRVDGDFFDFFKIDAHTIDIVVGDVMGKGIASALLGAAMKSHFLRAFNELILSDKCKAYLPEPGEIVSRVHSAMISHMEALETFVTLCYARIDLEKNIISFVDCGHMRTIHFHRSSNTITLLEGVNMPLGLPETDPFEQISVSFDPGDFFFFYSDGVTEAQNSEGELYGEERLADFILGNAAIPPEELIRKIRKQVTDFACCESFEDDFTCVVTAIEKDISELSEC